MHLTPHLFLLLLAPLSIAQAAPPVVYDATFPDQAVPKPMALLEPGMKPTFWCSEGDWMCPPASRTKHGANKLLPADHPRAWINTQEEDIDRIIAEANRRKLLGADPLVVLDFETWSSEPVMFPRIAELLHYYKTKSGRPACFYPGSVTLGLKQDWEAIALVSPNGEFRGHKLDAKRRAEIDAAAAKALPIYQACDIHLIQLYSYSDAQLRSGDFEIVVDAYRKLREHYFPRRPILVWTMAHHLFEKGEPVLAPDTLLMFSQLLERNNPDKQAVLWGKATPSAHILARLMMGEKLDPPTTEPKLRPDPTDEELSRIKGILKSAGDNPAPQPTPAPIK